MKTIWQELVEDERVLFKKKKKTFNYWWAKYL